MVRIHNRVIFFVAILQCVAFGLPFFSLKENRIVNGTPLYGWDLFPPFVWVCLALVLLLSLLYAAYTTHTSRALLLCPCVALLQLVLALVSVARATVYAELLGATARLGLHFGFWVTMFTIVVLVGSVSRYGAQRIAWASSILMVAVLVLSISLGVFDYVGIQREFINNRARFLHELLNHLFLVSVSVAIATFFGVPLGIYAWRKKRIGKIIFSMVNSINTVPSLALFGLIIGPLSILTHAVPPLRAIGIKGIGNTPAIIALSLYALLPIVQNTYSGLANISHVIIDAAVGMGMNRRQLWQHIEFPLSFTLIFNGFRTATTQAIGNAAVAALIGAAGLGSFIFRGLGSASADLIMLGVLPIVLLSMLSDRILTICNHLYQRHFLHRRQLV